MGLLRLRRKLFERTIHRLLHNTRKKLSLVNTIEDASTILYLTVADLGENLGGDRM